jgi:hypothetical protein
MNPFQNIINSLHQAATQFVTPRQMVQATKQPSQSLQTPNLAKPLSQMGGVPGQNFSLPLNPRAQALLKNANPVQQAQALQQQNPFVNFLASRGVRVPKQAQAPFLNNQGHPGQQQSVMSEGFNPQNLMIPNQSNIPNNFSLEPQQQQKGDVIQ